MVNTELFRYDIIQKFNETEIMLYKYMISNAEKIPYMTIRELAAAVNVSTSTIIRFGWTVRAIMISRNNLADI